MIMVVCVGVLIFSILMWVTLFANCWPLAVALAFGSGMACVALGNLIAEGRF